MSTVKSLHSYDGKLANLHRAYVKIVHGLRRQLELFQMKNNTLVKGNSAFAPIGPMISSNIRTLFYQTNH